MNPPKMPIHIGDYKRDTGHLRAAGHGAYLLLMFHHWSTGGLPDDDDQLAAIACMTRTEWKRMRPVIEKFFQPGWRHGRIEKDLEAAKQSYEKRAKAGEKGGKAKADGKQSSSNATAGPEQPLTFNHTNQKKKEGSSLRSDARSRRGSPFPDGDWLGEEDREYARKQGISEINQEFEKFRDHALAKGRTAKDWHAAWRNWCTSPYQQGNRNGASTQQNRAASGTNGTRADPVLAGMANFAAKRFGPQCAARPGGEMDGGNDAAGEHASERQPARGNRSPPAQLELVAERNPDRE